MHESVTNLLEEAEKIPHVTPGSLRSAGEFYIPTSPRPTHWYGWVAIPRLASLGWGYLHLCRDAHDLSEVGDMYTTYIILRARATHLLCNAITRLLQPDREGLRETWSISTEMHVSPAERSEPERSVLSTHPATAYCSMTGLPCRHSCGGLVLATLSVVSGLPKEQLCKNKILRNCL